MADSPDIRFRLLGDSTNLFKVLEDASGKIKSTTGNMEKQFSGMGQGITKVFDGLKAPFLALGAVLGGGALLKGIVDDTKNLGGEVRKLSNYFQVTNSEAGLMALALKRMGSDSTEFIGITDKMTKQLKKNEERFNSLGVATRESNGDYRNQIDILNDAVKVLKDTEGNTAKNIKAQELAGKGGKELATYMVRYADAVKHTEDNLKRLGVALDWDGLASNSKKYKLAMDDINQVFDVIKLQIGNDILPALTDLASFFAEILPPIMKGVVFLIKAIVTGFNTIVFIIKAVGAVLGAYFGGILDSVADIGDSISKLFHGDFKGAYEASKKAGQKMVNNFAAAKDQIASDYEKLGEKLAKTWDGNGKSEAEHKSGGKGGPEKDGTKIVAIYQAELEAKRIQQAKLLGLDIDFYSLSKQEEFKFWTEKLSHYAKNSKQYDEIAKQVDSSRKAMKSEELAKDKAQLDLALAATRDNTAKQLMLAYEYLTNLKKTHAENSKEVLEAQKQIEDIKNKGIEAEKKINTEILARQRQHELSLLDLQEIGIKQKRKNLEITGIEEIRLLNEIAEKKFQIQLKELQDKQLIEGQSKEETERVLSQIQALHDNHSKQVLDTKNKTEDEFKKTDVWMGIYGAIAGYLDKARNAGEMFRDAMNSVFSSIETGLTSSIQGLLTGAMTIGQAFSNAFKSMATSVVSSISQIISKMLLQYAVQSMISKGYIAGKTAERVADLAGIPAKTASASATTAKATADAAGTGPAVANAAGQTFEAHAGIPIVGAIIAAGLVLMMLATMSKVTAHAKGGLITKPTLALMGEAGQNEVVANETDFKSWANSLLLTGAQIQGSIGNHNSRMSSYNTNSNNYATALSNAVESGNGNIPALNLTLNHSVVGHTKEGLEEIYVKSWQNYQRRNG